MSGIFRFEQTFKRTVFLICNKDVPNNKSGTDAPGTAPLIPRMIHLSDQTDGTAQRSEAAAAVAYTVLGSDASGPIVATLEALSFWGGVDPATGTIIDVHHPLRGVNITGVILMMPTSRGSCTGSGILLDLILNNLAPAALLFSEAEDVLTLGALVGAEMFNAALPVLRLSSGAFKWLSVKRSAKLTSDKIEAEDLVLPIVRSSETALNLTARDRAMLDGQHGPAVSQAMRIVRRMALQQGATSLTDISRAHIDGCIYASQAN